VPAEQYRPRDRVDPAAGPVGAARALDVIDREALDRLAKFDVRKCLIAELRCLWEMTIEEVAVAVDIHPIRVKQDWKVARMWL